MAIANPALVTAEYGQSLTTTVTLSTAGSISGWTVSAYLRAYNGGTILATGTCTATDTINGIWTVAFTATDLTQAPGAYVWSMHRTNSGYEYPIFDSSGFIIRPSDSSAYPTLTNLSEYLATSSQSTVSDSEAKYLIMMLSAAETSLQRLCNRRFCYKSGIVEYLDGSGTYTVMLDRVPVTSIASVYLDQTGYYGQGTDAFGTETLLTAGTDYVLVPDDIENSGWSHSGTLRRIGTVWPQSDYRPGGRVSRIKVPCPGCIKVTYSGGFQLIPYDIKQAVWQITTQRVQSIPKGRMMSTEAGEGYSYSAGGPDSELLALGSVQSVVQNYRRYTSM